MLLKKKVIIKIVTLKTILKFSPHIRRKNSGRNAKMTRILIMNNNLK